MYKIFHNIDGEKTTVLPTDSELISFMSIISTENEDDVVIDSVDTAIDYLSEFCPNLTMIVNYRHGLEDA